MDGADPAPIAESLDRGDPVYVHCWGGVGRTGTVVACHTAAEPQAAREPGHLLAAIGAAAGTAHSPFAGFEGASPELIDLWMRYSQPIDRPLADLRAAYLHLAEEALALAAGPDVPEAVGVDDIRAAGFDPSEDPPDQDDGG